MNIVPLVKVLKTVTSLVASASSSIAVKNAIAATTPQNLGRYETFMVKAGGFFVGGAVGAVVSNRIDNSFDKVIEALERPVEEDTSSAEDGGSEAIFSPKVDVATFLETLAPNERAELERLIENGVGKDEN